MKSLLTSIKNLVPYILLIATYFFFVNIEAKNDDIQKDNYNKKIEKLKINRDNISEDANENERISIPVIPYNQ
tara:strand:- start:526 stop:744 length:219 start_codon:yes stop_codon:yes gene_type:complete